MAFSKNMILSIMVGHDEGFLHNKTVLLEAINKAKIPNNAQISQKYDERRRPRSDSIPQSM